MSVTSLTGNTPNSVSHSCTTSFMHITLNILFWNKYQWRTEGTKHRTY